MTVYTFLDRAVIEGTSQVRIVHGVGTGRLMQAGGIGLPRRPTSARFTRTSRTPVSPYWSSHESVRRCAPAESEHHRVISQHVN
jgi:hypothetical protein